MAGTNDPLRLLGRLTAGVLHDLNNYLNIIGIVLELHDRTPTDALRDELQRALTQAGALTSSVLQYIRATEPALAPVDLAIVVQDAVRIAARAISPDIAVVFQGVERPKLVRGAAPQLGQLVMNLALNAADAMPAGGTMSIVLSEVGGAVRLEVADTGRGLPAEAVTTDPTWTPSSKAGRGQGGLGLGIVRAVAERHDAMFELANAAPHGAVARVTFPPVPPVE
jgi:signal transduction histidine kinase